jgi:hypothetical protein
MSCGARGGTEHREAAMKLAARRALLRPYKSEEVTDDPGARWLSGWLCCSAAALPRFSRTTRR